MLKERIFFVWEIRCSKLLYEINIQLHQYFGESRRLAKRQKRYQGKIVAQTKGIQSFHFIQILFECAALVIIVFFTEEPFFQLLLP